MAGVGGYERAEWEVDRSYWWGVACESVDEGLVTFWGVDGMS